MLKPFHPILALPALNVCLKSIAHMNYRQFAAAIICFVFLFAAGTFESIGAVSVDPVLVPGYDIFIDGQSIGTAAALDDWSSVLYRILQEYKAIHTMDVTMENDIEIHQVYLEEAAYMDDIDIERAIRSLGDFRVEGARLIIDGIEIAVLKSEEDIVKLLEKLKQPYEDISEGSALEAITFKENIEIDLVKVDYSKIQDAISLESRLTSKNYREDLYTIVSGDTLWSIIKEYNLTMDTILSLNSDVTDATVLRLGQQLRVMAPDYLINIETTETVKYTADIAYETKTQKDSTLYTNQSKVIQKGEKGTELVEARVVKHNGLEQGREILSREVTKEPIQHIIAQGTKAIPAKTASTSRSGGLLHWPTAGTISSPFGTRWGKLHAGIDIANVSGTSVYAAEAGKVIFSAYNGNYGNLIQVDHGGALTTYYAHLKTRLVKVGQQVTRGQLIGYMGSTGRSTGPHLHFEVRVNGKPLNPMGYLR